MIDLATDAGVERALPGTGSWVARIAVARGRLDVVEADPCVPPVASDGEVTVLFDGVLYNSDDLARELGASEGKSDAALLLAGYRRYGAELVQHMRGIFALVIVDGRDGSAALVRDALGIYSLFYARAGGDLVVSPFIEPLVRQADVSRELNVEALADHFCGQWPIPEETFYRAVSRVVPGHALHVGPGSWEQHLWWQPPLPSRLDGFGDDDLDRFEFLLQQAVQRSLDLGPAAVSLSGGVDSCTVAAVGARLLDAQGSAPMLAASVQFDYDAGDREIWIQQGVADKLGMPLLVYPFDDIPGHPDYVLHALETVADSQCPDLSPWNPAYARQGREVRDQGRSVIMTGNGGDEWMGVSAGFSGDLMRVGAWRSLLRLARSTQYTFQSPMRTLLRAMLWDWGIKAIARSSLRDASLTMMPNMVHARWRRLALQEMPVWVAPGWPLRKRLLDRRAMVWPTSQKLDVLGKMRKSLDSPLVSMEAEESFELSKRTGVSYAHPLLDVDLVEFLSSATFELLTIDNKTKGLARRVLQRELPEFGFEQQRKFSAVRFGQQYIYQRARSAWEVYGPPSALDELGIVDGSFVNTMVENALGGEGGAANASLLWSILAMEAWVRKRM